jgi:hypothetical protein
VTGSDTSANALFATLQQTAGVEAGIDPTLLVAANTSGGVVGKMISLQNLAIAASAVGMVGRESELLRFARPLERRPAAGHVPAGRACSRRASCPGCCRDRSSGRRAGRPRRERRRRLPAPVQHDRERSTLVQQCGAAERGASTRRRRLAAGPVQS